MFRLVAAFIARPTPWSQSIRHRPNYATLVKHLPIVTKHLT
jgi:hypothetical protein